LADGTDLQQTRDAARIASARRGAAQTWFLGIIAFAVVLFLLVQAKFILISLVVAIILFSLTSDAINWVAGLRFGRLRIPMTLAAIVAFGMIAAGLFVLSVFVVTQANTVVQSMIGYTDQMRRAVVDIAGIFGPDAQIAAQGMVREIDVTPWLRGAAGQAGQIVSAAILITLFVGFLFAERIWFTTKLQSLFGDAERAERAERIVGSIIHRINRYLLVKTLVSAVTGLLAYAIAHAFGLTLAAPIGFLTFVLNYIPNVGSIVATVAAALLAFVQLGDVWLALAVLGCLTAVQFVVGQVIDPLLLGRALRLSSLGIIVSLAFWAAVWGIAGMFLAVPIMVAVMIVSSHIPALRPVAVILSREGLPDTENDLDPVGR
jgi:predicted PurR-regulated permease PerM